MKMNKIKTVAALGALGLSLSLTTGCNFYNPEGTMDYCKESRKVMADAESESNLFSQSVLSRHFNYSLSVPKDVVKTRSESLIVNYEKSLPDYFNQKCLLSDEKNTLKKASVNIAQDTALESILNKNPSCVVVLSGVEIKETGFQDFSNSSTVDKRYIVRAKFDFDIYSKKSNPEKVSR